ncbi:uncharacterized protein LOC111085299 [Limulus polyphemus]|uniref:Uncharacterized protein LOC111085299 n=1 Tax=Limulus polyphemus TaxID=6850 RepID=A0ABM1S5L0_LIMPO|nr:uncharacterized protein LOC111085299 [Limulus polyphemus]
MKNLTSYAIELTNSVFTGIARNVVLPCNANEVIVKVCDAYTLCVNATQPVDARCTKLGTTQGISSLKKLITSGYCLRAWSVVENLKEVLIEQDSMQLLNTVIKEIEDCYIKIIEQYQNIFHDGSDQQAEELEGQREIMSDFQSDNFTDYMKVELLAFQDAIFQSFKILGSQEDVLLFPKTLTVTLLTTHCHVYSGSTSNITISSREKSSQVSDTSLKSNASSGSISNISVFYGIPYVPPVSTVDSSIKTTTTFTENSTLNENIPPIEPDFPRDGLQIRPVFFGMPHLPPVSTVDSSINTTTTFTENSTLNENMPPIKPVFPRERLRIRPVFFGMPHLPPVSTVDSSINTTATFTENSTLNENIPPIKPDSSREHLPNTQVLFGMPYALRISADMSLSTNTSTTPIQNATSSNTITSLIQNTRLTSNSSSLKSVAEEDFANLDHHSEPMPIYSSNGSLTYNTPRKRVLENDIPVLSKIVTFLLHLPLNVLTHSSNTSSNFGTNSIHSNYGYQDNVSIVKGPVELALTKLPLPNAFFDLTTSKSIACVQDGNCETMLEKSVSHKLFRPQYSNRLTSSGDFQSHYESRSDMMPLALDDAKFQTNISSESYENITPENGTLHRNSSHSVHHVLKKRQSASDTLQGTDALHEKLESPLIYFGNEDFAGQDCVFRISQKKVRNLLEEMMYQLQWDLDHTDKKVELGAVQVSHNTKDKSINITQKSRQSYQTTVYYSRDAGNYLVSATWTTMLEEYKSRNRTFREVVEYEIRWDFDDSHDIMAAGLVTEYQSKIISRGSCQTLLQPDGIFYQLEQKNRVLYLKTPWHHMTMKWISMFHERSLYITFTFSTEYSTCPDKSICQTLCISVKQFSLEAATYVFPRPDSKLISEVISIMPSYSEKGAMFWGKEFQISIAFPILTYDENAKCSRWNGKIWEDNYCQILEIRSNSLACMTFFPGFYGIFTSQKSNGNTEFAKVDRNTFTLYNGTNPVAVQITLISLNGQLRKQQGLINHIQVQLAAILGVHTTRIGNVRLLEDPMQIQFTILPASGSSNLETSAVEALRTLSKRVNAETLNLTDIAGYTLLALPHSLVLLEPDDEYFNKGTESAAESTTSFGKFKTLIALLCGLIGVVLVLTGLIILKKRCRKSASVSVAPATFPSSVNEEKKY